MFKLANPASKPLVFVCTRTAACNINPTVPANNSKLQPCILPANETIRVGAPDKETGLCARLERGPKPWPGVWHDGAGLIHTAGVMFGNVIAVMLGPARRKLTWWPKLSSWEFIRVGEIKRSVFFALTVYNKLDSDCYGFQSVRKYRREEKKLWQAEIECSVYIVTVHFMTLRKNTVFLMKGMSMGGDCYQTNFNVAGCTFLSYIHCCHDNSTCQTYIVQTIWPKNLHHSRFFSSRWQFYFTEAHL